MSLLSWTLTSLAILIVYFIGMWFLMRWTFGYNTLNRYAFQRSLNKEKTDLMHYIELAAVILLLIGILTTLISLIQIVLIKRNNNG